jgi:hypothetical protein
LTALVSKRVYPDKLPKVPVYPAITYHEISETEIDTFNQPTNTLMMPVYQFNCWGETRASAKAVAKQLRLAFKNYKRTTMGGAGGVTVSAVRIINRISDFDTDADGRVIAYRRICDFEISYQEVS